jgi:hypothetical protein
MNSDEVIDLILSNLRVVGMVKKQQKLCIRQGKLSVDALDTLQPVRRFMYRDSRETTYLYVKNTVYDAIKMLRAIKAEILRGEDHYWVMNRLEEELKACVIGIENLKTTYSADSMTTSSLDVLIKRIQSNYSAGSERCVAFPPHSDTGFVGGSSPPAS